MDSIDPKPVDVSTMCQWVMEQLRLLADEKQIAMTVQTTPMIVQLDTAFMKRVLVNVIDNAIKYTSPGGKIELISFASERMAVIEVRDTGVGIPPAELPHVFERFFRADKVRSRASGGTGLGLSIVKAICNAHGGSITLRSQEGVGTVVHIELPLAHGVSDGSAPLRSDPRSRQ
jgi:signal transduction histidine kinase